MPKAFLEEMQKLRNSYECKVIEFILMFDHIHLILNPEGGDIQTSTGILKSLSAKKIVALAPADKFAKGEENQVWQESFKSLPLWSPWMVNQKINYIHANPVKAGLCSTAKEYPWSSFRSFYRNEQDPLLQIDKDWWWDGDAELLRESVKQWETERLADLSKQIETRRNKVEK